MLQGRGPNLPSLTLPGLLNQRPPCFVCLPPSPTKKEVSLRGERKVKERAGGLGKGCSGRCFLGAREEQVHCAARLSFCCGILTPPLFSPSHPLFVTRVLVLTDRSLGTGENWGKGVSVSTSEGEGLKRDGPHPRASAQLVS